MTKIDRAEQEIFHLVLIKPSHYDEDGYVIQWWRSEIPSNTLAALHGLALDCIERKTLGDNVHIEITAFDETHTRINTGRIARMIRKDGGQGLVAMAGVQSNQFPHAVDLARQFIEHGIQICIGGFHVSGCLSMLPELPQDIKDAQDMGISMFAGEAEGRLEMLLADAYAQRLKPLYNYMDDLPSLEGVPTPNLPKSLIQRTLSSRTTFDSGRGCPFQCSFCTIINVQGRKSRYRSADDIEAYIRRNHAHGITKFFITDDNFARNKNWEGIFDRLIKLREEDGLVSTFIIQVDTLCHQIPNFVTKSARAGVNRVFIGLENVNPDNLLAANKKQNRITEYRKMLQMWKDVGCITYCGYIIGFPNDTPERVARDIEILKRELPVDLVEFFVLTPLPGSEDHQQLDKRGVWMDPDMNIYDAEHVTTAHPLMSPEELQATYAQAWRDYYSDDHVETIMRRAAARGIKLRKILFLALWFFGCQEFEKVHPLQGGILRRKYRRDRRYGMPLESRFIFYPRYAWETLVTSLKFLRLGLKYARIRSRILREQGLEDYTDLALSPVCDDDLDVLELYSSTESAKAAVKKVRQRDQERARQAVAAAE